MTRMDFLLTLPAAAGGADRGGGTSTAEVVTNGGAPPFAATTYRLTQERAGRSRLPAIGRRETLNAGKVLGIRRQEFLEQQDSGFATDSSNATTGNWDRGRVQLVRRDATPAPYASTVDGLGL